MWPESSSASNVDDWSSNPLADDLSKINLQHFHIASILDIAYDFAFQTGAYWRFGGDEGLRSGSVRPRSNPGLF